MLLARAAPTAPAAADLSVSLWDKAGRRNLFLDKQDDAHWAEQLQWRKPNLLIFEFGANESGDGFAFPMDQYHETMKAVLQQARKAVGELIAAYQTAANS